MFGAILAVETTGCIVLSAPDRYPMDIVQVVYRKIIHTRSRTCPATTSPRESLDTASTSRPRQRAWNNINLFLHELNHSHAESS